MPVIPHLEGLHLSKPGSTARRCRDSTKAVRYPDYDFAAKDDCLGAFGYNDV